MLQILFGIIGLEVIRKQSKVRNSYNKFRDINGMKGALERIKNLGIQPDCIIDAGAAKGAWSQKAKLHWPTSTFILIEPLIEQIDRIEENLKNSSTEIHEAVAGKEEGSVVLNVSSDLDGSGVYGREGENSRRVKVVTFDGVCGGRFDSILLKLDTHGYEIPIFEGSSEVLKKTTVIIVEVYGFHVSPTGILFHEISAYLGRNGFRMFDIVDIMRRPNDKAFWQADVVYLRADHSIFSNNSYH